ncbi:TSG6 protein, partial [Copsychus sechellarum]|nr:TSG6 protein [Copsychus sechellarum]
MIALLLFSALLWDQAAAWGFKDGVLHNSIWLERAAGVYHRESRSGKYRLTYAEAKAVCEYEGGHLATYQQLEAARKIGFHVCAAGWMAKGRVGYPIVKAGANCGFGKTGIVDYGIRLNRSERWDAYCYNPNGECSHGGCPLLSSLSSFILIYPLSSSFVLFCPLLHLAHNLSEKSEEYNLRYSACSRLNLVLILLVLFCGDELPDDIISTGNVMTLKFLSDASVTAGGFQIRYSTLDTASSRNSSNPAKTNFLSGKFGIM